MAIRPVNGFLAVVFLAMIAGCAPSQLKGTGTGEDTDGLAGTFLAQKNPWHGGVVGAVAGPVAAATIDEISARGAREAVLREQPVEYRTNDGRGRYYAEPMGYDPSSRCRKVRERIYADGTLVKGRTRDICEGQKQ